MRRIKALFRARGIRTPGTSVYRQSTRKQWLAGSRSAYEACVGRGVREEMAKVTLARKIVAIVLRLWKSGETFDATKLKMQMT
jgi:hypothetical protein